MALQLDENDLKKFIVIGDRILIKPKNQSEQTKSGLYLPPGVHEKEKVHSGYVLKVGPGYPISVKLNSADFQRGGLTEEESLQVITYLDELGIDLLEISGGTYEQTAFLLMNAKESTRKREAYFIDFAKKVRSISSIPLMVTGGFRSYEFCNEVLRSGEVDLIGMARPFISNVGDIPSFLKGEVKRLDDPIVRTGIKAFEDAAEGGFHARQLMRLADGKDYDPQMWALPSSIFLVSYELAKSLRRKKR